MALRWGATGIQLAERRFRKIKGYREMPALIRAIRSYYAAVDKALIFESEMKVSRVGLVDAQQQSGLSPADATPASELVQTFAGDPALLAAAKNYWLYTNRHLKVMKQLRRDALALVAQIDSGKQP